MENGFRREKLGGERMLWVSDTHTFGTDAVVLADFASPRKKDRALDLGTGCGIIPLLWLSEEKTSFVTGVDISPEACTLAEDSARENGWTVRFEVVCADMKKLKGILGTEQYDLVTCNPPYFKDGSGFISPNEGRADARSELACTIGDVCASAAQNLRYGGRFCICHRPERLADVLEAMRKVNIEPKRLRFIEDTEGKAPWLFLAEGRKGGKPSLTVEASLVMKNADGTRTEEMKRIYGKYGEGVD